VKSSLTSLGLSGPGFHSLVVLIYYILSGFLDCLVKNFGPLTIRIDGADLTVVIGKNCILPGTRTYVQYNNHTNGLFLGKVIEHIYLLRNALILKLTSLENH